MTPYWTTFLHLGDLSGLERHYGRIRDSLIFGSPSYINNKNINIKTMTSIMRRESSNVRKKVRKPSNVRKQMSHVMLELHNVRMEPSSVRKK